MDVVEASAWERSGTGSPVSAADGGIVGVGCGGVDSGEFSVAADCHSGAGAIEGLGACDAP